MHSKECGMHIIISKAPCHIEEFTSKKDGKEGMHYTGERENFSLFLRT